MGKMFLMCGLSGAGKTTFAKKFAEDNRYQYLSIDDLYKERKEVESFFHENGWSPWDDPDTSFEVWIEFFKAIHRFERHALWNSGVVIDTNAPTFVKRAQFIDWFPTFDEHNLIYIEADRGLRRRNNASRDRVVPDDEIERMEQEFEYPLWIGCGGYAYWTNEDDGGRNDSDCWDHAMFFLNENNILREIPIYNN